jgi:toxin ParE1/3/4
MSKYLIVYTEKTESDLHNIFEYVAYKLVEPQIAKKLIKRIIENITKLDDLPMRHAMYEKSLGKAKDLEFYQ